MPNLNIHTNILAFADTVTVTSNPKLRNIDWTVDYTQIPVRGPKNEEFALSPGETKSLLSLVRTITSDASTVYQLSLNPVKAGVYRLAWVPGEDTSPGFRTRRSVNVVGGDVIVAVNNNATVSFESADAAASDFADVAVGDTLFIPDATTGDSQSPFNILNVGFWQVLAKGANSNSTANHKLICKRLSGEPFQGAGETVTPTVTDQFIVFSPGPVRAGDQVRISDGFSSVTWGTYVIQTVTDTWVEFSSGESLPLETNIQPGASGITIYADSMCYVRVEVDQPAYLRLNGSTGNEIEMKPRANADLQGRAHFELYGVIWSIEVVNRSPSVDMNVQLLTAAEAT